ncbi:MAG: Trp biosynthesis-associated membrane protein [Anaerolineaceae bacterium]|nr:Trp biosynthesis-associated membrane protein [Anaerolineaceae bacterium]
MKRGLFGFNPLALIASGLMAIAMYYPWWSFRLEISPMQSDIYPYVIIGPASELVGYKRSPQMTILTVVLIASIVICLLGSFFKRRVGSILLVTSSLLVFLGCWRLMLRLASIAARFDLSLQGEGFGTYEGFASVRAWTWIRPGLYLALLGGVLALIAGLLNNKISLGGRKDPPK